MSATLMPLPKQQFLSPLGAPLIGGKLYTYAAGTTDPKPTYTDAAATIPQANPITLNTRGEPASPIYWTGAYKVEVRDGLGNLVYSVDNFNTDPSGLLRLLTSAGASLVGFLQAGTGAIGRWIQDKLRESVSVRDYGALGDGLANDTAAILKADTYAGSAGKKLFFPSGTYMVDPLTATTSWFGELGTLIKYRGAANVDLVTATGIDNITFTDLAFDGSVSADPGAWSAANYDTFTGASGLTVGNCEGANIVRCRAKNTRQHGFRLLSTTNALLDRCSTNRSRGNFGDGFYMNSTIGTKVRHCHAYDFTRIGFVADTFGNDPKTSYGMIFVGNSAEYGHDCSILYGGGEYNAGAWFENSAHFNISDFTAKRMNGGYGRGMVLCTGIKNNGVVGDIATFNVANVTFESTGVGLIAYSLGNLFPVAVTITGLKAYKVYQGVNLVGNNPQDSLVCKGAFVDVDFTINPNVTCAYGFSVSAGLAGKPTIQYLDCVVAHTNENLAKLNAYGTDGGVCDVGAWVGDPANNGAEITVRNMQNATGGPVWLGTPYRHPHDLEIIDTYLRAQKSSELWTGSAILRDCRIHSANFGDGTSAKTELYDCTIEGETHLGGTTVRLDGGRVLLSGTDIVWLFSTTQDKRPAIVVANTMFEKDVAAGGHFVRIGFAGNFKCTALFSDVQFYNTSGTVTANPCMKYTPGPSQILYNNVLKDATITNIYDYDTGGNLGAVYAGVSNVTFH